jgi:hypothetical protein
MIESHQGQEHKLLKAVQCNKHAREESKDLTMKKCIRKNEPEVHTTIICDG